MPISSLEAIPAWGGTTETGAILHYDGSVCSEMTTRWGWYLSGVWGTSSSGIYAVGDYWIILKGAG